MSNNDGAGATQAKSGDNAKAISRPAGYGATLSAVENKTKSGHPASSMANHWTGVSGYGENENIVGYKSGNSS
jgi:hypothetical protein